MRDGRQPSKVGDETGTAVIFDSDACFASTLASFLRTNNWIVTVSHTRAAHVCRDAGVCVVDICPDGRPDFDLLRLVRSHYEQARIVVATAYASVAVAVEAIRCGANECVQKPITPPELWGVLHGTAAFKGDCGLPSLARVEWEYICRVLGRLEGNISATARVLGIRRSTLQRRLQKFPPAR